MAAAAPPVHRKRRIDGSLSTWRWGDRIGFVACWGAGIGLCLIAAGIVLYMAFQGLKYLDATLLVTHPNAEIDQSKSGGFLDPIIGTVLLTVIGNRDRHADRGGDRRVARRVRPPRLAGAPRRVGPSRSSRARPTSSSRSSASRCSRRGCSPGCRSAPRAAPCSGARS